VIPVGYNDAQIDQQWALSALKAGEAWQLHSISNPTEVVSRSRLDSKKYLFKFRSLLFATVDTISDMKTYQWTQSKVLITSMMMANQTTIIRTVM
jgi:hypothetical protein